MFRLTREVRFAIGVDRCDDPSADAPTNSYAGYPSMAGLGHYFALQVTLAGALDPDSQYLRNIKEIDQVVRQRLVPRLGEDLRAGQIAPGRFAGDVVARWFDDLRDAWPGARLDALRLSLSPFLSTTCLASEHPMVRLSQKFEFSAAHRLHNPALSPEQNRQTFGKCNNPLGHGHNYEVQVTLAGMPDDDGLLIDVPQFERIVGQTVIERYDHKNLNAELPEFRETIPSVENIAQAVYRLLKPKFEGGRASLATVTVWETPKTCCEYAE